MVPNQIHLAGLKDYRLFKIKSKGESIMIKMIGSPFYKKLMNVQVTPLLFYFGLIKRLSNRDAY